MNTNLKYTPKDFKSDQEVKWCPGCGDHAILAAVQKAFPEVAAELGREHEDFTIVSGIGCSSRFPYYMNTYGFHSIHGRAAAIATGVKVANPNLCVWQISGDGDSLAIGGNHFIHAVRRNINVNIVIFNNEIYGLTKGQYSPTSKLGKVTKTSPFGTVEHPFNPGELVLGARGRFFARSLDVEMELTKECLVAGAVHDGASVIEVLQNCVIFNDKTFDFYIDKATRADRTIVLRHGQPMIFGTNKDKGLVLDGAKLKVVTIGEDGITENDLLKHDAYETDPGIYHRLVTMHENTEFPLALGVIRDVKDLSYDFNVHQQVLDVQKDCKIHSVDDLLNSGETWLVE